MEQYNQYDRSASSSKPAPILNDYSAHRGSEGGGLSDRWHKLYETHPKRVWGAGACCCVCLLIVIIVGSLVGTVARTTNAKLLSFVASFDELCAVSDNTLAASFNIELDNPSSIGVGAGAFTLEIRRLQDNMDTGDGEPAIEVALPDIEVPGGRGSFGFSANVKIVDLAVAQRIASEFISQKPVVVLLKGAVPAKALGITATLDVAFPFYLNNSMRMPNPDEPAVSLDSATFVSDDEEKLVVDISMRVNGSDKFLVNVPSMSLAAMYTDAETTGPNTAVVGRVKTTPFTFKEGWNTFNFSATLPGANASITGGAFKDVLTQKPLTLTVFGSGGDASCWMQQFLSGMLFELALLPKPPKDVATFQRVDLDVRSMTPSAVNMGVAINLGTDLRVRGPLPPLVVGVKNQNGDVLVTAAVDRLSLEPRAVPFDLALQINDVAKLTKLVSDIANGVPAQTSIGAIGTSAMARIAARYQIVTPFHGYVNPFATATPAPTNAPPPAMLKVLRGGGLSLLELTSNDPDALVLAIEFALPPIVNMSWALPPYTLELAPAPNMAPHSTIALRTSIAPATPTALSVVKLTATVRVSNYEAAARTINAILAREFHTLSIKGASAATDVIGQFLTRLEPIVVSRAPATPVPVGVTTIGGANDTMAAMMAAAGFKLTKLSSRGMDGTGRWATLDAGFALGQNATIKINLVPPPQITLFHQRPAPRGGGEVKLVDVELRSVTGSNDAFVAGTAVTANNRSSTDLAINMLLKSQQVALVASGTSQSNSLFAKLLAQVRYKIVLAPAAPAKTMSQMSRAVLLGMKYESSSDSHCTIGIDFDADLPIQPIIDVGDVRVEIIHQSAPILGIELAQLRLLPNTNKFSIDATINGQNRAALEDAVGKAVFLPPANQPPQQFLMRATIKKAEWGASGTIPIELLFDMPPGPDPTANVGKDPNNPLKCTELEALRICPKADAPETECLNLEQLKMGGVTATGIAGLLSGCSISVDLAIFLTNPTTLDFRIDEVDLKVQFDDKIGFPVLSFDPRDNNTLGIVDIPFKGAQVSALNTVRIPITLLPTVDATSGSHEMCIRAGWNMVSNGKILIDLTQGFASVRLDKFPLKVPLEKKGIPAENVPKNLRVKCIDYLANINVAVEPLGKPDRV
jgi:hypothetical protein